MPTLQELQQQGEIKKVEGAKGFGGFAKGAGKGALSTLRSVSEIGERAITGVGRAITPKRFEERLGFAKQERTSAEELIPERAVTPIGRAEKIGFGAEQIAEFFIPASTILKGSKALQATRLASKLQTGGKGAKIVRAGVTRGIPEAIGGGTVRFAQTGDVKQSAKEAALFGAFPVGIKTLSTLAPSTSRLKSILTGVSKDIFERIKKNPVAYDKAMSIVSKTKAPFQNLAEEISTKLNALKEAANTNFASTKSNILTKLEGVNFNFSNKIPQMNEALGEFNLVIKKLRGGNVRLEPTTKTSPFLFGGRPTRELNQVQDIVSKMNKKDMTVNEVLDFQASIRNFFNEALRRDDKKMVALMSSLLEESTKIVDNVIPELKAANKLYSNYYKSLNDDLGKKIVNSDGTVRTTAEQFLANLGNRNKGITQKNISQLEAATGIPILDNVLLLKDAQKLNNIFPATGSRTLDIIRSLGVKGAAVAGVGSAGGGFIPGALGAGAVVAATSPKLAARETIAIAKFMQKFEGRIPKNVRNILNRITGEDIGTIPKGKGVIPPTTLLTEAKKFKTADEFVKAQKKVFHGTSRDFKEFDASKLGEATGSKSAKDGFWFTDDISTAKSYSKAENEKRVGDLLKQGKRKQAEELENKIFANQDPRFLKEVHLNLKNPKIIDVKKGGVGSKFSDVSDEIDEAIRQAKEAGNDGLIIKNLSDHADFSVFKPATHTLVFDVKNIKTKSQLTDIFTQAKKTK